MSARSFLAVGTPMLPDALWAWHHCFTHVFPFRPWVVKIVANAVIDGARRRGPPGGGSVIASDDGAWPLEPVAVGPTVDELADHALVAHRVPDLLALIVQGHLKGEVRSAHMRHTLARLPRRHVKAMDLSLGEKLALGALPVARTDAQMAVNLGTTVTNVESTRANYRAFVAKHHPELAPTLELVLSIALGKVDPLS